jgi:VanZ family protein
MSWAPFVDYYWGSRYQALDQFARRSLSFAPLGVLLALAFGSRERRGLVITVGAALLLGVIVEFGQYFIPERHPSVTDLLIQVFGAWLGYNLARHVIHVLTGPADIR